MNTRLLLLSLALVACGDPDTDSDDPAATVVGGGFAQLTDFGVLGVLEHDDGTAIGYLCGQGDRIEDTSWLSGQVGQLSGADWDVAIADGSVTVTGTADSFTADFAPIGQGGLFEAAPQGCRSGLIVSPDGSGFSAAGTFCAPDGAFAQVEPVGTIVAPGDFISVQVQLGVETLDFDMTRIR